jgi:hypothetical protein
MTTFGSLHCPHVAAQTCQVVMSCARARAA